MTMDIWLCGASLETGDGVTQSMDIGIKHGKIAALGSMPGGAHHLDCTHLTLAPAFTDLSARLREPGDREHGSIVTETAAALAGGFAQLVLPPDTRPVMDTPAIVALVLERAAAASKVRVFPLGALTRGLDGQSLANMAALKAAGCIAVSQARRPMASAETLLRCLEYAAGQGLKVFFSPEDASLAQGCAHDGFMASRLGLPGIPSSAETVAMATQLLLVAQTGIQAHFGQLSTAGSVMLLRWARSQGLPVTADVSMHQLHLTDESIDGFNAMAHVRPPLRSESDRQALLEGVREGTIDAICSDHQPLDASAKLAPFAATMPGMSTLETMLGLGLRLVRSGELSRTRLVDALAQAPRRVLGQATCSLCVGDVADLVAFDERLSWQVFPEMLRSHGHNTPFLGQTLQGKVVQVWVEGQPQIKGGPGLAV